jgi:chromosome segregation ATPase
MIEMSINEKKGLALKARESDLSELRNRHTEMETGLRKEINTMSLTLADRQRQVEGLAQDKQKLKEHKKILKTELHKQRKTISDLESYSSHKAQALKTLSDFFTNKTLKAVKAPTTKPEKESKRRKSKTN